MTIWNLRESFLSPIPDLSAAADLLALATDSLLACNERLARSHIEAANMPTLRAYTSSIMSQSTREIHRFRLVPDLPAAIASSTRAIRRPSGAAGMDIYRRDGFRCRYCGCRIILPVAQSVVSAILPYAVEWGRRDIELNAAFYTLKGVIDYVVPHAHGGTSEPDNLVTSCQPCNYGKGNYFLQQLGLSDPRLRSPNVDSWDGLSRVLPLRPARTRAMSGTAQPLSTQAQSSRIPHQSPARKCSASIDEFASSFGVADRQHLDVRVQAVEAVADIGVYWTLKQVLLVKIPGPAATMSVLGVEPDGTVQIPWWIGPYKQVCRPFAETLAAALPDGRVYETSKMWRVSSSGRLPRIADLGQDPGALQEAFRVLHRALSAAKPNLVVSKLSTRTRGLQMLP